MRAFLCRKVVFLCRIVETRGRPGHRGGHRGGQRRIGKDRGNCGRLRRLRRWRRHPFAPRDPPAGRWHAADLPVLQQWKFQMRGGGSQVFGCANQAFGRATEWCPPADAGWSGITGPRNYRAAELSGRWLCSQGSVGGGFPVGAGPLAFYSRGEIAPRRAFAPHSPRIRQASSATIYESAP